jgi:adenosylcobinamide-phosphate synthase
MEGLFILLLAVVIDILFGEPPRVIHPVVWMGKVISFWQRFAPVRRGWPQLVYGAVMVLLTIFIFASPAYFLLFYMGKISLVAYIIAAALLLKSVFSFRELRKIALEIKVLLASDNLKEARTKLPGLVSRETQALGKPALVSATVESVAENTCDSFVAPLFYFLLLGVPGAVAYRVVNTVDAMIGYHGEYEYLGKFAARLDDVLNFVPARISGLLLVVAAYLSRRAGRRAWQVMLRDHGKTESPNAGWSMSAVAGALEVQLEKVNCYSLGNPGNPLSPWIIASGIKLAEVSALLWVSLCLITEVTHFVFAA